MKYSTKYILGLGLAATAMFASCSDLLDEAPDNRTEIDSPKKVQLLMTSAYPSSSAAILCELSSDNLIDNNVHLKATHKTAYYAFHEEAFAWEDINDYSTGTQDTPYDVWESYYQSVSVANHALEAIDKMLKDDPSLAPKLNPFKGEALIVRAYSHFVLVNVFAKAYRNDELSKADLGIPYVTEPETVVKVDYNRISVAEDYQLIEKDIEEGLPLIDDSYYTVPAYHFNLKAANAFAARFYLYKRDYAKVLQYADEALGGNPSSMLRKWTTINKNSMDAMLKWFNDETASCNFLLQSSYSLFYRMLSASRFVINGDVQEITTAGSGPCWSGQLPCYGGCIYIFGVGQDYGCWMFRVKEYFEYKDKIAGIGYVHTLYQPFTAEETLLCRAEAKTYLGDVAGAVSDLNLWANSKQCSQELTLDKINRFYTSSVNIKKGFVSELNTEKMSPDFIVPEDARSVIDCILHFRRIETNFEGLRWFDIKRYGIPVVHAWRGATEDVSHRDSLGWDDPRRALQIPLDVISAGFEANDRTLPDNREQSNANTGVIVAPAKF